MTSISRRSILKSFGAATATLALPGVQATVIQPKKWDETVDVLIVGAGGAGMSAAMGASESKAGKILVIEKAVAPFLNSTCYSAGAFNAAVTKTQKEKGITKDTGDLFAKEIMAYGGNVTVAEVTRLYAENSGRVNDWFYNHGVRFTPIPNPAFAYLRQHMCNGNTGAQYIELMCKEAEKRDIEVRCNTKAVELITNEKADHVLGVRVDQDEQTLFIRTRKAVVLTTGGFGANFNMIDNYLLNFRGALTCTSPNCQGEGLLMAQKIGAASTHMNYCGIYAYGAPTDEAKRRGLIFRGHVMNINGSITVNPKGERFIADETGQTEVANEMARLGFKTVIAIASADQLKAWMDKDAIQVIGWKRPQFEQELKEQEVFVKRANSPRELAQKLGMNPAVLEKTIADYNKYAKQGKDPQFNRKFVDGPLEGELFAFVCKPVVMVTAGGLRVNGKLEVLDVYNNPIGGLLAAGEVVGGIHGNNYIGGCSIGQSLTLGHVAGELAAKADK